MRNRAFVVGTQAAMLCKFDHVICSYVVTTPVGVIVAQYVRTGPSDCNVVVVLCRMFDVVFSACTHTHTHTHTTIRAGVS